MIINCLNTVKRTQLQVKSENTFIKNDLKQDVVSFSGDWKNDIAIEDCIKIAQKVLREEPSKRYNVLTGILINKKDEYHAAGMQMYFVAMADGMGDFFKKEKDDNLAATCFAFASKEALDTGHNQEAIPIYKKAALIAKEKGDKIHLQARYGKLGLCYKRLGKYKEAIAFNLKAIDVLNDIVDDFDLAIKNYSSNIIFNKNVEDYQAERGYLCRQTAYMEFRMGDYKKSVKHYKKALNDFSALNKSNDIKACYFELSRAYKMMGDSQQADATMKKADDY